MGLKALLYFEIVTTIALFIGLGVVNLTKPGYGVALTAARDISQLQQTHAQGFREMLVHIFPSSVLDAMARGDVLQIVAFAALFAVAVSAWANAPRRSFVDAKRYRRSCSNLPVT